MPKVIYATRRSALALAQCRAFVARLASREPGLELEELQVVTSGDRIQDRPLSEVGGKGLFVKEIEEALLEGRAHLAVHSIKDVPGVLPPGLVLTCIPAREDPRDALVSPRYGALAALPDGATVGTSSLRRAVALRHTRPDLRIVPLRGNVDTRLRKVDEGQCDAIVLARSGLVRLGLEHRATEVLEPEVSLPAVGQGALGIECREEDTETRARLAALQCETTAVCVAAERGVMVALEGDCRTPIGAFGQRVDGPAGARLRLRAFAAEPDGTGHRAGEDDIPWPASLEAATAFGLALGKALHR
jgi:hydroxymethylbilane synthase